MVQNASARFLETGVYIFKMIFQGLLESWQLRINKLRVRKSEIDGRILAHQLQWLYEFSCNVNLIFKETTID